MNCFIQIIKFIATLLITNSHYDLIYPISQIATGGSIGNSLFFFVSGYCLYNNNIKNDFLTWIKKRIIRIYPTVIIGTCICLLLTNEKIKSISKFIATFIYPTKFWFITAMIAFYFVYYFIMNSRLKNHLIKVLIFLSVLYMINYILFVDINEFSIEGPGYFKWIFYFQIMILGTYLKQNHPSKGKNRYTFLALIISLIIYFGFKFLMLKSMLILNLQFILHIITFFIVYLIFKLLFNMESIIKERKNTIWYKIVNFFANITLEIYVVQMPIIDIFAKLIFPLNFLVTTLLIIILSILVNKVSLQIQRLLVSDKAKILIVGR